MSSLHLHQPASVAEAIDLLSGSPEPFDTPTHHLLRTRRRLERAFAAQRRAPGQVWAARDDDGHVHASVAGLAVGDGLVLDHWGGTSSALPRPLAAATEEARRSAWAEAHLYFPPGVRMDDPVARPWHQAMSAAGWQAMVERLHYQTPVTGSLGVGVRCDLRLEPLTGPTDERLPPVVREMLRNSLDAHDIALVERVGLEAAAVDTVASLLEEDPWECVHLAFDEGTDPIGLASWVNLADGHGYVNQIGVVAAARGQGYGRQLLGEATRALIRAGATTVVADTDAANHPMAAAFASVGWVPSETRVDFLLA